MPATTATVTQVRNASTIATLTVQAGDIIKVQLPNDVNLSQASNGAAEAAALADAMQCQIVAIP